MEKTETNATLPPRWLNRNVLGMGLTSFLSDFGHEMATAILPAFLSSIGASAAALGLIEGIADATSSFVKLGSGWWSDRLGHRKPITSLGYFLTGISKASFAFAQTWHLVLAGRVVGWFGRGIRGPLRDAMLAESVEPEVRGKAFGFERACDTLGAVAGPLVAFLFLSKIGFRDIFFLTLIPGLASLFTMVFLVREKRRPENRALKFWASIAGLPHKFKLFLVGVAVFGIADFAPTLLILRATELLSPEWGAARAAQMAVMLYVMRNVAYAAASFPFGALSDRVGRRGLLASAYGLFALMCLGFIFATPSLGVLFGLFVLSGIYIAGEDSLERVMAADLLPDHMRAIGYGVLGTVNGLGDLVSSVVVGWMWVHYSPTSGFLYAAVLAAGGALVILRVR